MIEATFIASGKTMQEALNFTASLVNKIMFEDESFRQVRKIDIFCNNIDAVSYTHLTLPTKA